MQDRPAGVSSEIYPVVIDTAVKLNTAPDPIIRTSIRCPYIEYTHGINKLQTAPDVTYMGCVEQRYAPFASDVTRIPPVRVRADEGSAAKSFGH